MNGSKPCGPPGNRRTPRRRHAIGAARRLLSPHPDPLPRGEGTASLAQWIADGYGLFSRQSRIHPLRKYLFSEVELVALRRVSAASSGASVPADDELSAARHSVAERGGVVAARQPLPHSLSTCLPKGDGRGEGKRRIEPPVYCINPETGELGESGRGGGFPRRS